MLLCVGVAALLLLATTNGRAQDQNNEGNGSSKGSYFRIEKVNPSLPKPEQQINLATPQACVEHFILQSRRENYASAARAMNFRLVEPASMDEAAQLAERLHYLINQNLWIDWSTIPDRPDGMGAPSLLGTQSPMAGQPRRSILLGTISFNGRDMPIRIERVKPQDGDPVWLFAAQTVDNINPLYDAKGPSWLARQVPTWSRSRTFWRVPMWQWIALAILILLAVATAYIVVAVICRSIAKHLPQRGGQLIRAIRWPAGVLTSSVLAYSSASSLLTLPGGVAALAEPFALFLITVSATWLVIRIMGFLTEQLIRKNRSDELTVDESGALVRLTVFRYVLILTVAAIGMSIFLISMDLFRTLGLALLGSAGAAAVLLGIAGHAVLGNLIMGVQIALAKPFRTGDTVIIEGYWGRIEELRYTYVVVRTWDEKRIVLPVKYFMENWFENWSKTDPYLIRPIYLKLDYRADVQAVREKFMEFVREDDLWVGEEKDDPDVLVTDFGEETMTVRLTSGGEDSSSAWQLSCRVREKMIAWLQEYEDGRYLPRQRLVLHKQEDDERTSSADEDVDPQASHPGGDSDGGDE
jgi:small-conductance mechanosensitive channel